MRPVVLENVKTGGDIDALFSEFMELNSSSSRNLKGADGSFRSLALSGTAKRANLGTNLRNVLHIMRNENGFMILLVLSFRLCCLLHVTRFQDC